MKTFITLIAAMALLAAAWLYLQQPVPYGSTIEEAPIVQDDTLPKDEVYVPTAGYEIHTYDCGDGAVLGVFNQVSDNSTVSVEFAQDNAIALRETLPVQTDSTGTYYEGFGATLQYTDAGIEFSYADTVYMCVLAEPTDPPVQAKVSL